MDMRRNNCGSFLYVVLLVAASFLPSCQWLPEVGSVRLSENEVTLRVGETRSLSATVEPAGAEYDGISWFSSIPTVATVVDGKISAVRVGTTTVTASAQGVTSSKCEVTVRAIQVTGVSLNTNSIVLTEGETFVLRATVSPSNATDQNLGWTSLYSAVASVSDGVVTAKSAGTTTISVRTNDGGYIATCQVTVKSKTIAVTGVSLNRSSLSLKEGETSKLTAMVTPSNATNKEVSWSSSNTSVATVASDGSVTANGVGSATITVTTADGVKTATCSVTVETIPVSSITLSQTSLSLTEGETSKLSATVSPANATNKDVVWSSSNSAVASVSSDGTVTAKSAGTVTITCASADGDKSVTCSVTVKAAVVPVTGISLSSHSLTLIEGGTFQLSAAINPSNATDKNVIWSSGNMSVASVSSDGLVTAAKAGSTAIYCKSDSGAHDLCYVFVYAATDIQSPLTFEVLNDGVIFLSGGFGEATGMSIITNTPSITLEYQVNNSSWAELYVDETHHASDKILVKKGDIVRFRGNNKSYSSLLIDETDERCYSISPVIFCSSSQVSISGNIMSLIDKNNYKNLSRITDNGAFAHLFRDMDVISAERLYLPTKLSKYCYYDMFAGCKTLVSPPMLASEKLESNCYRSMFYGCISLLEAPVLPAKSLVFYCYRSMFYGCSALKRIEAYFDTKPSKAYTNEWVFGVNPSGQFYKSYYSNWEDRGVHGIPDGWEIVNQ